MTTGGPHWIRSHRADPVARVVADRHYNRQKPGTPQFVPPGSCLVLRTRDGDAIWVTSWPKAEFVKHAWAGAWVNSCFRNEAPDRYLSSDLIVEALARTVDFYGAPPALGMVTFINAAKTKAKRDPGRCYRRAGFGPARLTTSGWREPVPSERDVFTQGGLVALQLLPDAFPGLWLAHGRQRELTPPLPIPRASFSIDPTTGTVSEVSR